MNRRGCPACAERYPLQDGLHCLPDGNLLRCGHASVWRIDRTSPPGVVTVHRGDGHIKRVDLFARRRQRGAP